MVSSPEPRIDWNALRDQMPVARRWAYFDHAAVAPLSLPAQTAINAWTTDSAENGDTNWLTWSARVAECRESAARLLAADADEVALVPNTTAGINLVAEGLDWRPGDNVVLSADEFPSNQYPWLNVASRGVAARRVEPGEGGIVSIDRLLAACDQRTRVVAVSWVGYAHGWRHNVYELVARVHERGALVFLDAIQGLGMFPLDVQQAPVDFLAADGHKWLLGPEGAGVFYVRREHLDRLRPIGVGWNSVVQGSDYGRIEPEWKPSAARYEGGTYNVPGFVGLGASLDLLQGFGPTAIGMRLLQVTADARERLRRIGAEVVGPDEDAHRSGIVAFEMPDEPCLVVRRRCLARGVVLSCRAGRIRISPHAYTSTDDLDRLIEAIGSSEH